jgi:hypothetical protein
MIAPLHKPVFDLQAIADIRPVDAQANGDAMQTHYTVAVAMLTE